MKIFLVIFFLISGLSARIHESNLLGITITIPDSFVVISSKPTVKVMVYEGIKKATLSAQKFINSNKLAFSKALNNKPIEILVGSDSKNNITITTIVLTNKNLNVSSDNIKNMCNGMKKNMKSKMGVNLEFCKKSKINRFDALHTRYKALVAENNFTEHYIIHLKDGQALVFMHRFNVETKNESLNVINDILNSLETI